MRRRIVGLVRKEFAQILRDRPLVFILLWTFTVAIYTSGNSRSADVDRIPTAVYDLSQSAASRDFLGHLRPPYFKIVGYLTAERDVGEWLDTGRASIVVLVPPDFHRCIAAGESAHVQVLTDGALATSATVAIAYIAGISAQYSATLVTHRAGTPAVRVPSIDERLRVKFNPNMLSTWFGGLLELMTMFAMVSLLLTSANMVREKEHGTLEQLLVSPARPFEIFVAKMIPTLVVVLSLSGLSFLLVLRPLFHLPVRGSLMLFYSGAALFVFAMTSLGMAIAVVARSLAQAMMIMILVLQPMVFLSGAWNPPEAMIPWLRTIGMLSPLRYFIDFGYSVILKGSSAAMVGHDLVAIAALGAAMFAFSITWFQRSLR